MMMITELRKARSRICAQNLGDVNNSSRSPVKIKGFKTKTSDTPKTPSSSSPPPSILYNTEGGKIECF
jgi:hypothetical protein